MKYFNAFLQPQWTIPSWMWYHAIYLSITTGISNGYTEGQNNNINISYGCRNFTYFRNRIMHIASNTPDKCQKKEQPDRQFSELAVQKALLEIGKLFLPQLLIKSLKKLYRQAETPVDTVFRVVYFSIF